MTAFFGCWGDLNNAADSIPQCERVLGAVQVAAKAGAVSDLVVAGDNYYMKKVKVKPAAEMANPAEMAKPAKEIKRKYFLPEDVSRLVDILSTAAVPTTLLYGNHEWDTFNDQHGANDQCQVIDAELAAVHEKNKQGASINMVKSLVEERGPDLWVMLDTSMFEYTKDRECYNADLKDVRAAQLDEVFRQVRAITHPPRRVFIVGHHPICIFRQKEGVVLSINALLARTVDSLMKLIGPTPSFYYLCADFHVYQHQQLTINERPLEMHIVGTGGASLDAVYVPSGNAEVSNQRDGQYLREISDPNVTFYEKNTEPLQVTFNTKGALDAKSFDDTLHLTSDLVEGGATYGYLKIADDIRFVALDAGGGVARKSRRTRRKLRRTRRKSRRNRRNKTI